MKHDDQVTDALAQRQPLRRPRHDCAQAHRRPDQAVHVPPGDAVIDADCLRSVREAVHRGERHRRGAASTTMSWRSSDPNDYFGEMSVLDGSPGRRASSRPPISRRTGWRRGTCGHCCVRNPTSPCTSSSTWPDGSGLRTRPLRATDRCQWWSLLLEVFGTDVLDEVLELVDDLGGIVVGFRHRLLTDLVDQFVRGEQSRSAAHRERNGVGRSRRDDLLAGRACRGGARRSRCGRRISVTTTLVTVVSSSPRTFRNRSCVSGRGGSTPSSA